MPTDPAGDTKIYPDSTTCFKWAYEPSGNIKAGERHNIGADCEGEGDHSAALQRGYMCDPCDWKNFEMKVHHNGNTGDDEMTLYGRGGRHTDGCACCGFAYKMGFRSNGNVRLAKESWHVNYDWPSEQNGPSLSPGNYPGVAHTIFNVNDNKHVRCQGWVDPGGNNQWQKVIDFTDSGSGSGGGHCGTSETQPGTWGGPNVVFRCDDFGYNFRNMTAREIGISSNSGLGQNSPSGGYPMGSGTPYGSTTPPTGNGCNTSPGTDYPGTGGNTGGGGAGNDSQTGTGGTFAYQGCACANGNCVGSCGGTGGGTSTPSGPAPVTEGGAPSTATEPAPLITVYKDLGLFWNIRVDLEDNCNVSGNANVASYIEVYTAAAAAGVYQQLFSNGHIKAGCKVRSEDSSLWRERIRKVSVTMKKSSTASITGNVGCEIRDRNGNLYHTFDTTITAATIALNDTVYDFVSNNNEYRLESGDMILLTYEGGNTSDHVLVAHANTDVTDGFDTAYVRSTNGTNYEVIQVEDFAASISA